ncbi:MAG TPA: sulfatase [Tepidisphaeraceae bacterium]|nr:sulfatase [Tepidisphaeraceae bacterium]
MRILYIDIDSQRADHLGCYGYHRNTSPNIDRVAADGVRFDNCYVSDAPCLPSRTALWSGRFGIHTGVINHGGVAADPFIEGPKRGFHSQLGNTNWMRCLRNAGYHTATISPFGERHSAWHWYAGFSEIHNPGKFGGETADMVGPMALDWLSNNGKKDNWFLHVNFWDPHTPYRTPDNYGDPFKNDPLPKWLTEEVRARHWSECGPHSAREVFGFEGGIPDWAAEYKKRQPGEIDTMDKVRQMFDGYDTGVKFADDYIGRLLNKLADLNLLEETVVVISADHGENLGELNIYGDHQTADNITSRVPLIVRWPGVTKGGRVDSGFHYHFDFAATMIEMAGAKVPEIWDGRSFAESFKAGQSAGRDSLVISQGAWTCQRSARFDNYLCMKTYHDGFHNWPDVMLYDIQKDPHLQHDLADSQPELRKRGLSIIDKWHEEMMRTATHPVDPMDTVLKEGGPFHIRGFFPKYLNRLRATGREKCADALAKKHGGSK